MYHITTKRNYKKIMEQGLVPKIGPRSKELGESNPFVYLFKDLESVDNALANWLGDMFSEEIELVVLEVNISGLEVIVPENSFEILVKEKISPDRISFLRFE